MIFFFSPIWLLSGVHHRHRHEKFSDPPGWRQRNRKIMWARESLLLPLRRRRLQLLGIAWSSKTTTPTTITTMTSFAKILLEYYYPSCHLFSIKRDLLYKYHRPIMIIMYDEDDNENYILHFDRLNIFLLYSCWFVPFLRHKEEAKASEWTNGMRAKLIKDPKKIKKIIYICIYRRNFCLVFKII